MTDLYHQTAPQTPYPPDVGAFADALEAILAETHQLEEIVAQLNARGVRSGSNERWTPASFTAYLAELAKA